MKNIRLNVFETNSSSTHSISISKSSKGVYETLPVNDGWVVLTGGEFGWDWAKYNDALTKANYAAVFAFSAQGPVIEMFVDLIKKHTGAKEVEFNFTSGYGEHDRSGKPWAYIDHQSGPGEGGEGFKAFESQETLKEFIFNPDSWLFIGNDNEEPPPNFYDVGDVKYTHVLKLDDLKQYLKNYPSKDELKDILSSLSQHLAISSYENKQPYRLSWNSEDSFAEIDKNILMLFQTEPVYDNKGKYLRTDVVDTKKLKFRIVPIIRRSKD